MAAKERSERFGGAAGRPPAPLRILLQSLVLLVFLGLWTWKLFEPYPVPDDIKPPLDETWNFIAAKSVHLLAYAFLAFLATTLPVPRILEVVSGGACSRCTVWATENPVKVRAAAPARQLHRRAD